MRADAWPDGRLRGERVAVTVSSKEVERFRARWPDSGIYPNARFKFFFERNGDLAEIRCSHKWDNYDVRALCALADEALAFVLPRMRGCEAEKLRLNR